jgi:Protein of unknown function (DUF3800)
MPRRPWVPLPHEADLFCNVYIDESSQTKHRYLILGGLVVPLSHAKLFESDIIAARDPIIAPFNSDGTPRVIKWEKVKKRNVESYKKVFDAFWRFEFKHQLYGPGDKHVDVHCVVVDTSKKSLRTTGAGDPETGFNIEIYFLCAALIAKRFDRELFHIYPDRRDAPPERLREAQKIMNLGVRKYGDTRDWPIRRLQYADPEYTQALQVVDIMIGALAFKLNGHYDKPEANPAKKELCDYILKTKAKIFKPLEPTRYTKRRFTIVHRDGSKYVRPWERR